MLEADCGSVNDDVVGSGVDGADSAFVPLARTMGLGVGGSLRCTNATVIAVVAPITAARVVPIRAILAAVIVARDVVTSGGGVVVSGGSGWFTK
ncbi:hypothetical protein [Kutzneria buriramensis]|uniref:hypothetical protein n=1 Tax=Kutzneria buriramensis TaxID=1045776 RepID=UPI000E22168C|nr:hypothetical protein [Kutzneria buriramensis]